jgi:hypothetical protein
MKATTLILAMTLATSTFGAYAAPAAGTEEGSTTSATQREWYQAGTFEQQDEAQKAELQRQGFPQYN